MTLRTGIAIFVKTPGHSPLKTRLAADIGAASAQRFHELAADAVGAVARKAQDRLPGCVAHWAIAEASALDDPRWACLSRLEQGDGDLGARMERVSVALLGEFDAAVLLGADAPQITVDDIHAAIRALESSQHVIGPGEDGGFWLFASRGGVPAHAWSSTPWSRADTAARFCEALGEVPIARLRIVRDVDRAEDLPQVLASLDGLRDPLPEQVRLAQWFRTDSATRCLVAP
ncbi:MAG: DUF2064 domain-containing protein [Arenimonas sp.]